MIKVALTHDIDRINKNYQYFTYLIKNIAKGNFQGAFFQLKTLIKLQNTFWGFDEIIDIEESFNVRSTLFFLNESLKPEIFRPSTWKLAFGRYNILDKKVTNIIKWLDNNGWEIGLHGSYNSYKDSELLLKEKNILENILGHSVIGVRQHYLNIFEKTWQLQYDNGFLYDSSFGFTHVFGFKNNVIVPFHPFNNEFIVFPMIIMDKPFVGSNQKWEKLQEILEIIDKNNSVLVINWHNNYFNELEFPAFKTTFIKIIDICKNAGAQFYTLSQIYFSDKLTK